MTILFPFRGLGLGHTQVSREVGKMSQVFAREDNLDFGEQLPASATVVLKGLFL